MIDIHLPTLGVVLGSAAIDSINPCAIGVLILMISIIISQRKSIKRMLFITGIYILAIYITYFLAGLGLIFFLANIPITIAEYISIFVGTLVVIFGLFEIKDYFWYGLGFSLGIPPAAVKKIHSLAKNVSVGGAIITGVFVAGVELPCTGGPYLAITAFLSQNFNLTAFVLLLIYNVVFIMPLVVITLMVAFGTRLHAVKKWKQEARGVMRLAIGLLLVGLGWLLILIANGTINFG